MIRYEPDRVACVKRGYQHRAEQHEGTKIWNDLPTDPIRVTCTIRGSGTTS